MFNAHQTRRSFLQDLATVALAHGAARGNSAGEDPVDLLLRISPVDAEIAKNCTIRTIGYNGSVPGPLIRLHEGSPVSVELINETDAPEFVHWHGFILSSALDGTPEENSLAVPAHGHLRYRLIPRPSGARFVHTHAMAMDDLSRSTFTGQYAFVYLEPKTNPGRYDQEVFLATHEWDPYLVKEEEPGKDHRRRPHDEEHGWEVAYRRCTINGKCLGFGEPVRVKEGQRVLFHFLNASATENVELALPRHRFKVVGLDGNPVPHPAEVEVLKLGTAERIDAVVTMNTPGVWVLGTPDDSSRKNGMGIVVEYANRRGKARWIPPAPCDWDYVRFGNKGPSPRVDEVIPLVFGQIKESASGFEEWTINGEQYDERKPPRVLSLGARYRLVFDNRTDDEHPVHLHRDSFELTNVHGQSTRGLFKDVVLVDPHKTVEADLIPAVSGLMLFHCHQQLHMDHGFKLLFDVK